MNTSTTAQATTANEAIVTTTTKAKATTTKAKATTATKAKATTAKAQIDCTAQAQAMQITLVSALQARKLDAVNCSTIIHDLSFFESANGLSALERALEKGLALERFVATAHETNKRSSNFIALKVITKIKQTVQAVASNSVSMFDGYSHSILRNLLTVESIDTHNILRCLSAQIVSDIEDRQAVKAYISSGATTASTQSSSSRQMLEILDICQVIKGKKLDAISYKTSASGKLIKKMLTKAYAV